MKEMARKHYPNEVGTSVVGRYSPDGFRADVLGLAPLSADSVGTRFSFLRGVKGLKQFYDRLMHRFHGQRYYVGEWHSHPDGAPQPSGTDRTNQSQIASDNSANCEEVVLIILGGDFMKNTTLNVQVYSRTSGVVQLVPVGQTR